MRKNQRLVAILPVRSDAVCQAGQPLVQQYALHVRCPSWICAGASVVHGVCLTSRSAHRLFRRRLPPVRLRQSVVRRHGCSKRQGSRRPTHQSPAAVKRWFLLNDLLLNADKSDIVVVGTAQQLRSAAIPTAVDVAGCSLQVSTQIKSLGVVIDDHLPFDRHVSAVASACMYHARALWRVRGVLSTETAKTIACRIAASRLDRLLQLVAVRRTCFRGRQTPAGPKRSGSRGSTGKAS